MSICAVASRTVGITEGQIGYGAALAAEKLHFAGGCSLVDIWRGRIIQFAQKNAQIGEEIATGQPIDG
jgi:hypothetical protein